MFFDGECLLCMRSVKLVHSWDSNKLLSFSSLDSNYAMTRLEDHVRTDKSSLVVLQGDNKYIKSDAVIKLLSMTGKLPFLKVVLKLIPTSIRNGLYDLIAKNRHLLFIERNSCAFPLELKSRIIE